MKNEITKYVEYLFALAIEKCRDVNDAEDLTQETLLAAFQYNMGDKAEWKLR